MTQKEFTVLFTKDLSIDGNPVVGTIQQSEAFTTKVILKVPADNVYSIDDTCTCYLNFKFVKASLNYKVPIGVNASLILDSDGLHYTATITLDNYCSSEIGNANISLIVLDASNEQVAISDLFFIYVKGVTDRRRYTQYTQYDLTMVSIQAILDAVQDNVHQFGKINDVNTWTEANTFTANNTFTGTVTFNQVSIDVLEVTTGITIPDSSEEAQDGIAVNNKRLKEKFNSLFSRDNTWSGTNTFTDSVVVPTSDVNGEAVNNSRMTAYVTTTLQNFGTSLLSRANTWTGVNTFASPKLSEMGNDNNSIPNKLYVDNLRQLVSTAISTINAKIPIQASASNQLADKNFLNSSIATNTANFITTQDVRALGLTQSATHQQVEQALNTFFSSGVTNNDFAFVYFSDSEDNITRYDRYKYNASQTTWKYEYTLNNSSFTANQWLAINSGITAELVEKLVDLYTNDEIDSKFENYYTDDEVDAKFNNYYDKENIDDKFELVDDKLDILRRDIGLINLKVNSFEDVARIVERKETEKYFKIGEQLTQDYVYSGTHYECPMNIVDINPATILNDNSEEKISEKALWLEWDYTNCSTIQFDPAEALISVKTTMPAGTYYFKVANDNWASQNGKFIQFTLTSDLTAGQQLKPANAYNVVMAGSNMNIYNAGNDTTVRGTVVMSEGQEGTYLGEMWGTAPSGIDYLNDDRGHILNHYHRVFLGYNSWKYSFIRQYMNASGTGWWTAQQCFDRAPSGVDSLVGFLDGIEPSLLAKIKPTKVFTQRNTFDGYGVDITYDKFFLATKKQMAWVEDGTESDNYEWKYYRELADSIVGVGNKFQNYATYPAMIKYGLNAKSSAYYVWKISAARSRATNVWYVYTSGYFSSDGAYGSGYRFLPACVISGLE